MLVGVLGILKAGGAYVALEPGQPAARLQLMLAESGARVLLTQAELVAGLPQYEGQVVCLDSEWEELGSESSANPGWRVEAENLAYVIYTSGSSGAPKGVAVEHRQVCNYVRALAEVLGVGAGAS